MDLWIKTSENVCSRNALVKVDNVFIEEQTTIYDPIKTLYYISTQNNTYGKDNEDFNELYLGKYKTKERALEILDEIQKLLIGNIICTKNIDVPNDLEKYLETKVISAVIPNDEKKSIEFLHRDCVVYEMPKD